MIKYYWLVSLTAVLSIGCKTTSKNADPYIYIQKDGREKKDWQIVWQDNFDVSELDKTKWTRISRGTADWRKHMTRDQHCYLPFTTRHNKK